MRIAIKGKRPPRVLDEGKMPPRRGQIKGGNRPSVLPGEAALDRRTKRSPSGPIIRMEVNPSAGLAPTDCTFPSAGRMEEVVAAMEPPAIAPNSDRPFPPKYKCQDLCKGYRLLIQHWRVDYTNNARKQSLCRYAPCCVCVCVCLSIQRVKRNYYHGPN